MKTKSAFALLLLIISGCVASHYIIKPTSNLNAYKYVAINPLKDDPYATQMELTSLFSNIGFIVLDKYTLKTLPDKERNKVLLCRYGYSSSMTSTIVYLQLLDIFARENIYNGKGEYGMGMDVRGDIMGAIKQAFNGVEKEYKGFSEEFVKYPEWENIQITKDELIEYFDKNHENLVPLEGIWADIDNRYIIGILKDTVSKERDFVAIIISTTSPIWRDGDVKIEFLKTAYKRVYTTTYYMANKSKQGATSMIDENGVLVVPLKKPDGSDLEQSFVKNYPQKLIGKDEVVSPETTWISFGSGFLIDKSGLIVTNYHVIADAKNIEISFSDYNKKTEADVLMMDRNNDIAILRIAFDEDLSFLKSEIQFALGNSQNTRIGQNVFTIGYPLGAILGKTAKLSTGIINALNGIQDDPRVLQISNPIQPGNSGGPLFNEKGEVVGIVVYSLNAKLFYEKIDIIPQNVNFAVKIDYLKALLLMLPEGARILKRKGRLSNLTLEDQVEKIKPYIVSIETN